MGSNDNSLLIVEDNQGDVRLLKEAFSKGKTDPTIHVVEDGDDALDFCYQRHEYDDMPRPDAILLDLSLSRTNGEVVLEELKTDPDLMHIPVIVLTSSKNPGEVLDSYRLHANAYLTKPVDPDDFEAMIHAFEDFWFSFAELPDRDSQ